MAIVLALTASARGDGINNPAVGGNGNGVAAGEGINNLGVGGSVGPPPVGCGAGQLDFSDACNTTLYLVILR